MRRINLLFWALLFTTGIISAQNRMATKQIDNGKEITGKKYLMDARPLLNEFNKENGIDFTKIAEPQNSLKKTAWNFTVGSTHYWWAQDLLENTYYSIPTTCRGVGNNCYVFVEDATWDRVGQDAVDQIINAFDNTTPANNAKGVYQTVVDTFGDPPNVDGDAMLIIVILDIRDGFSGSGGYTAGYFSAVNEYPTSTFANSNVGEFYYMDCNPLDLKNADELVTALQITAHEFQHMIEWNYHRSSSNSDFFNEGCSMIAEVACGYPLRLQSYFVSSTNIPTFTWGNTPPGNKLSDYGRAARFFLYVKEQLGDAALKKFVQSKFVDVDAFNVDVLRNYDPTNRSFKNFVVDWWIANFLNNKSFDSKYGYDYAGLPHVGYETIVNPNVSEYQNSIYKQGVSYFSFVAGKNLSITTNTNGNNDLKLKAIKTGSGAPEVVDVATNTSISMPEFGTTYSNITLMAYHNNENASSNGPFAFTFNSTGETEYTVKELSYDQNLEPDAVWGGTVGDTVAVTFSGVQGAKLDSLRIALRQAGSLNGGIYNYNTSWSPSPLIKSTKIPFTATSTISTRPPSPYPVPWPNWVTIDLRSKDIAASNNFATAMYIEGDYKSDGTGAQGLMYTLVSGGNFSGSLTFDNAPSSGLPRWIWYVNNSTQTYVYLIRAYVSFGTSDAKETVELLPSTFKLDQNYPNPFNPSTIIRYELPRMSNVQIKIYDALGKEVRSLIDEAQNAGTHNLLWDAVNNYGQRVSSGVYFYRIVAGDFVQTKKMILMK